MPRGPEPFPFTLAQTRRTNGHYENVPVTLRDVPAGAVRYLDTVVPSLPYGWDWHAGRLPTHNLTDGDEVVTLKMILPAAIGQVALQAAVGATAVVVASLTSVLRSTADGGALDPGLHLAFAQHPSADALNTAPATASAGRTFVNPDQEPREHRISGLLDEATDLGNGSGMVTVGLMDPLVVPLTPGTPVYLVIRSLNAPKPLARGTTYDFGSVLRTGGPLDPGTILRVGFRNTGAAPVSAYGELDVTY